MKKILILVIVFNSLHTVSMLAQGAEICNYDVKTDIINEINTNANFALTPYYDSQLWASSALKPDGTKPECLPEKGCMNSEESDAKYSCKYSARSAQDRNSKTAWAEGKDGDGIGEILLATLDFSKPIKIFAGLGLNKKFFEANNRPKEIKVYVIEIGKIESGAQIPSYNHLKIKETHTIELKDTFGYQPLNIPKYKLKNNSNGNKHIIGIEILSVYKGTKYSDTLISEISN
jgi:hypothetical protein